MRRSAALSLLCCTAALPLMGCAGSLTAQRQNGTTEPVVIGSQADQVYTTGAAAPAAVLVFVPAMEPAGADLLTRDLALWGAQGFDVRVPQMLSASRLIADREATLERLFVSARALADAPIWLVGPSAGIETAMGGLGPGQVSGVLVTSISSRAGNCTQTVSYTNTGTGAAPSVTVSNLGDACAAPSSVGTRPAPSGVIPPHGRPGAPRIIEVSIPDQGSPATRGPLLRHVAEEIKGPPAG